MDLKIANKWPTFRVGVALALAALLAVAIVSYKGLLSLVHHNQLVVHTLQVISELDATMSQMTDAESSQRGYLVTGDPSYLQPYDKALVELPKHLDQIANRAYDNPYQQSRIPALRSLVQERLETLKAPIALADSGNHDEARRLVATNRGRAQMRQIRDLISDMRQQEEQLLERRTADSRRGLQQAGFAFSVAWLFALAFTIAFFVTAQREARDSHIIREKESWLRTTLQSIGDAVIATDAAGRITFINRVAEQLIGCESSTSVGKPLPEVLRMLNERTGEPAANPVLEVVRRGAITGLAPGTVLESFRGESIPIEDSAAPIFDEDGNVSGVVLVFRDVSQQRKVQEIARTSEKLAATGRLAATIAHEINNPLEAAINLLFLAQSSSSPQDVQHYIASAEHELSRMAHITRKTLAFHRSSSVASPTNLRELLDEVLQIYDRKIDMQRIHIALECPPDLVITTFRGDLVQIASNLIANALDALEVRGSLTIRAAPQHGGACLEIEDNGSGIKAENLNHVFEPFFTTKKDTGTGLGLWVVKDLIEKLGGTISLATRAEGPRHGTRFSMFLPSRVKTGIETRAS